MDTSGGFQEIGKNRIQSQVYFAAEMFELYKCWGIQKNSWGVEWAPVRMPTSHVSALGSTPDSSSQEMQAMAGRVVAE